METFATLLAPCAGNSPATNEFPSQRPVMRSFEVFFDLRMNKWLSKQSICRWFETPSCPLWRHCNVVLIAQIKVIPCHRPLANFCIVAMYKFRITSDWQIYVPEVFCYCYVDSISVKLYPWAKNFHFIHAIVKLERWYRHMNFTNHSQMKTNMRTDRLTSFATTSTLDPLGHIIEVHLKHTPNEHVK